LGHGGLPFRLAAVRYTQMLQGRLFIAGEGTGAGVGAGTGTGAGADGAPMDVDAEEAVGGASRPAHVQRPTTPSTLLVLRDPAAAVSVAMAYARSEFALDSDDPHVRSEVPRLVAAALYASASPAPASSTTGPGAAAGAGSSSSSSTVPLSAESHPWDSPAHNPTTRARLLASPYAAFASPAFLDNAAKALLAAASALAGLSLDSPLSSVIRAGHHALPVLLKYANMCEVTGGKYPRTGVGPAPALAPAHGHGHGAGQAEGGEGDVEIPVELPLPSAMQYHSSFACPVTRQACGPDNPPMLLPCGHLLSRRSLERLAALRPPRFKCPTCPSTQTIEQARQLQLE
jgi:hypothetical protein